MHRHNADRTRPAVSDRARRENNRSAAHIESKNEEVQQVSEENIRRFYETIARIISEREQVKVTVQVSRKEAA